MSAQGPTLAYVMTHYPRVALSFISGEIDEIEALGGTIHPIAMNLPDKVDLLSEDAATSVFHLAAIVSGMAEADFDLGMRINVDATRLLLDACRRLSVRGEQPPRFVFASSVAVYGGALPDIVPETAAVAPQSSYGMQKAVAELLINDYTRKGFVDGRALRLPTIGVRPPKIAPLSW